MQPPQAGRRHLLLIEDSPGDVRLFKELLLETCRDYSVTVGDCLQSAFECRAPGGWDLILVDLGLPDSQNLETFARCRDRWPDVPIVVLSGTASESVAQEAVRAGAQDYLVKGDINARGLSRALRYSVDRHRAAAERRSLIQELEQSRKLEAIGQLAAGVAHEINTPTQYVSDNTRFLRDSVGDLMVVLEAIKRRASEGRSASAEELEQLMREADIDYLLAELPTAFQQSLEGLEHIARIVRAMKEFSHPAGDAKKRTDLHRALDTTLLVASSEWKYVAEVEKQYEPDLPVVECLPGEMNQVFLNLIVNAAHAIGETATEERKGRITIATRLVDSDWIEITIADTGTGIPEDHRSRVFEPFFTTKDVGKGTGQGLAIARNVIVNKHGGTIDFTSQPGLGTVFTLLLPVCDTIRAGKAA